VLRGPRSTFYLEPGWVTAASIGGLHSLADHTFCAQLAEALVEMAGITFKVLAILDARAFEGLQQIPQRLLAGEQGPAP
jgi:hypothetical protein